MAEYISRQAALDAVRRLQTYKLSEGDDMLLVDKAEVQTELMMLPSAQRESAKDTNVPINDCISRQAALDALEWKWAGKAAIDAIKALPSAQRKGKWIYLAGLNAFECSVCGSSMVRNIFDYCPWCGARMVKGESGEESL